MEPQRLDTLTSTFGSDCSRWKRGGVVFGCLAFALMTGCASSLRQVQVVYDVAPGSASVVCGGTSSPVCVRVDNVAVGSDWDHFVRGPVDVSVWAVNRNLFCSAESPQLTAKAFAPPSPFTGQPAKGLILTPMVAEGFREICSAEKSEIDKKLAALVKIVKNINSDLNQDEDKIARIWLDCFATTAGRFAVQKDTAAGLRTIFVDQNQTWSASFKAFANTTKEVSDLIEEVKDEKKKKAASDALSKVKSDRLDLDKAIAKVRTDVAPVLTILAQVEAEEKRTPDSRRPYQTATLLDEQLFDPNQTVTVELQQQSLAIGAAPADTKPLSLGKTSFNTLSPIYLDVGIGPAWIMNDAESWSVTAAPGAAVGSVTRSDKLNLDGVVTFSWYYWPRYLDRTLFSGQQFVPRPTVGLSVRSPFSSIYAGLQIDPVQFVDVTAGVFVYSRPELVGVTEGEVVPAGTIATRDRVHASAFVSVSSSINLFTSWFSALFK
jgi:hypothetical protein